MNASKKKILVINTYFKIGGIESALINMVNELSRLYSVDLLIYNPVGPMKERLAPEVNIIEASFALKAVAMTPKEAFLSKNPFVFLFCLIGSVWSRLFDNRFPIWLATKLQPKLKDYDLAISYRAETRRKMLFSGFARVLTHCVEAKNKAVWIHYDARNFKELYAFNEKYYQDVDKIVGVSASVAQAFKEMNPSVADKTDYCPNFFDYDSIYKKSNEEQQVKYPDDKFICFSACRLSEEKGLLRAIEAMAPTLKRHDDIIWYIAGDGPEREKTEAAIMSNGFKDRIILLGNQSNPYPYMKNADLYLSTSFHEAAPVVYQEAKALRVPIFTTETSSSHEMLKDNVEDFICKNSEEGIRERFAELMDNREMIVKAKSALENYSGNNDASLKKIAMWLK